VGVGRQTVSNVLNDSGRVAPATRARVLETVTLLGYQPHHGARSMRSRRTMQLAYIMPPGQLQPKNLIMMQFLYSLVTEAARRDYQVVVVADRNDPGEEVRRLVSNRSVDAFVLAEMRRDDQRATLLHELGMPFACFGRLDPGLPQHWVDIDNAQAEAHAVRHVLDTGFSRPCYIGYMSDKPWDADREAGYHDGLASRGIPGDGAGLIRTDDYDDAAAASAKIRSLITSAKPDVVFTSSDRLAIIVYSIAADLHLRVGRDLAVVGFDGSIGADIVYPTLTSVVIPVEDIARRVVARALRQVETGSDTDPGEIVPAWLRQAGSTPARSRA